MYAIDRGQKRVKPATCDGALDLDVVRELAIFEKPLFGLPPHLIQTTW